ncbi:MAG: hypothetical protein Q7S23_01585 [bacterium]|nr:hypothetical protein [bacterium]
MLFVIDEIRKCIKESLDEKRPAITPQFIDEFVIDTYYLSDLIGIKLVNMMEELFIYMRRVNRGIQATNKQYSYLSNLVITKQFEQDAQVQMKVFYFYVNAIGGMNENLEAMRKMIELEIRPKIKSITAYVRALLEKKPISKNLFEKLFANKYVQIDASMVNEKLRELETELVSNQRLHEERLRQIYGVDASHKE